jgi:hypothetical protein
MRYLILNTYRPKDDDIVTLGEILSYEEILVRFEGRTHILDTTIRVLGVEDRTLYRLKYDTMPEGGSRVYVHIDKYLPDDKPGGNLIASFDMLYVMLATVSVEELVKYVEHPCVRFDSNGIGSLVKYRLQGLI